MDELIHLPDTECPPRERGATAVEYALMVTLIAGVIIAVVGLLGTEVNALFKSIPPEVFNR